MDERVSVMLLPGFRIELRQWLNRPALMAYSPSHETAIDDVSVLRDMRDWLVANVKD